MTDPHELNEAALREAIREFNDAGGTGLVPLRIALRAYLAAARREPAVSRVHHAAKAYRDYVCSERYMTDDNSIEIADALADKLDEALAAEPTLPEEPSEAAKTAARQADWCDGAYRPDPTIPEEHPHIKTDCLECLAIMLRAAYRAERRAEESK